MYHEPVCVKCETEMRPEENDVRVVDMFSSPPEPDSIWCADKWKCPICGVEVVIGFGQHAYINHYEEDFEISLQHAKESSTVINNYEKRKK